MDQLEFLRSLMNDTDQKTGEEAFLGKLMLSSTKSTSLFMVIVTAMQAYAVNCSMSEALHPDMGATCYAPGQPATRTGVEDDNLDETVDNYHEKQESDDDIEKADKDLDWGDH